MMLVEISKGCRCILLSCGRIPEKVAVRCNRTFLGTIDSAWARIDGSAVEVFTRTYFTLRSKHGIYMILHRVIRIILELRKPHANNTVDLTA